MAQIKLLNVNLTLQSHTTRLEKSVARIFEGFTGRSPENDLPPENQPSYNGCQLTLGQVKPRWGNWAWKF